MFRGPHTGTGWQASWLLAVVVLAVLVGCGQSPEPEAESAGQSLEPGQRSMILITIDTLRPDRLEPYGARDVETPHVTDLAEEGVVFERAWAVAPITLPAHASILTGLYPPQHQARNNGINIVKEEITTLAEILAADGFRTGGFVAAAVLDRQYGLAQGFEMYDDQLIGGEQVSRWRVADRTAGSVVSATRTWLDQIESGERFFAWVHLFDPHAPYEPPEPFRTTYRDRPYDGEVAYVDSQIGLLLDHPRIDDRVVIAIVGDHGESLGAHGEPSHGVLVYDSTLRIPWILRIPGGPAGVRFQEPVSQVDVLPTLLGLVGKEATGGLPGRNLVPTLSGKSELAASGLYAESYQGYSAYGWAPLQSLVRWPWKLIQAPDPELFDLQRDPGETTNIAAEEPARVEALGVELARYVAAGETAVTPDEETMRALRSLGYLATGGPSAADDRERRNPRDVIGLHYQMLDFFEEQPRSPEAILGALEKVLEVDPDNLTALRELLPVLIELDRFEEAEAVIEKALSLDANPARILLVHARLERRRGDDAKARVLLEQALDLDPRLEAAWVDKVKLELQAGEGARAQRTVEEGLQVAPHSPGLNLYYARLVELPRGELAAAEERMRLAMRRDPSIANSYLFLAELLESSNQPEEAASILENSLERWPESAQFHSRLGLLLLRRLERPAEAEIHLRRALELSPESTPAPQAALEMATSHRDGAAPQTGPGLQGAVTHLAAGRLAEAEAVAIELLEAQPDDPETLSFLASIRLQRADLPGAEGYLRRAVELQPERADIWNDLGMIIGEQGRAAEAFECYSTALRLDPGNWQAAVNLGMLAQQRGRWQEAADFIEEALRLAPREHELRLLLADLYGGPLSRPDLARTHLETFLLAAPTDPRADLVRERLGQLPPG